MKLKATEENAYLYINVIKYPNPINIITWTSWNIGYYSSTVASDEELDAALP